MKKRGIIISGALAQDHEFIYPYYRLLENNVKIDVISLRILLSKVSLEQLSPLIKIKN